MSDFKKDLSDLINRYSMENESNTPDFILAEYLADCLNSFARAQAYREKWYGLTPAEEPINLSSAEESPNDPD